MLYRLLVAAAFAAGCQNPEAVANPASSTVAPTALTAHLHHGPAHHGHGRLPVDQLARVKRATERYRDIRKALADGYADINVVLPNMGAHYLKNGILDATFEVEKPELLVYSPDKKGRPQLVAVEYAVPLNLSATAPAGFRGEQDVWFANQTFQLWTLHAWIWKENPDGVFNATNKRVP